jgi:hypothetical protein
MKGHNAEIPFCEKIVQLVCRNDVIDKATVEEIRTLLEQHAVPKNAQIMVDLTVTEDKDDTQEFSPKLAADNIALDGSSSQEISSPTPRREQNLSVFAIKHQGESNKRKSPDSQELKSNKKNVVTFHNTEVDSPVRVLLLFFKN